MTDMRELWRDITSLGGLAFQILLLIFSFVFGLIIADYSLPISLVLGFVITVVVTIIVRLIYFKERPNKKSYNNLLEKLDASSFPSLHTARVTFLFFVFSNMINYNIFGSLVLGLTALLVMYSRIYLKKHDWIDVLGGIVLGFLTFLLVNRIV